jgi:hypothetical protein
MDVATTKSAISVRISTPVVSPTPLLDALCNHNGIPVIAVHTVSTMVHIIYDSRLVDIVSFPTPPTAIAWSSSLPKKPVTATTKESSMSLQLVVTSMDGGLWRIVPELENPNGIGVIVRSSNDAIVNAKITSAPSTSSLLALHSRIESREAVLMEEPFSDTDDHEEDIVIVGDKMKQNPSNNEHKRTAASSPSISSVPTLSSSHTPASLSTTGKRRADGPPLMDGPPPTDVVGPKNELSADKRHRVDNKAPTVESKAIITTKVMEDTNNKEHTNRAPLTCVCASLLTLSSSTSPITVWPPNDACTSRSPVLCLRLPTRTPSSIASTATSDSLNSISMMSMTLANLLFGMAAMREINEGLAGRTIALHGGYDGYIRWMVLDDENTSSTTTSSSSSMSSNSGHQSKIGGSSYTLRRAQRPITKAATSTWQTLVCIGEPILAISYCTSPLPSSTTFGSSSSLSARQLFASVPHEWTDTLVVVTQQGKVVAVTAPSAPQNTASTLTASKSSDNKTDSSKQQHGMISSWPDATSWRIPGTLSIESAGCIWLAPPPSLSNTMDAGLWLIYSANGQVMATCLLPAPNPFARRTDSFPSSLTLSSAASLNRSSSPLPVSSPTSNSSSLASSITRSWPVVLRPIVLPIDNPVARVRVMTQHHTNDSNSQRLPSSGGSSVTTIDGHLIALCYNGSVVCQSLLTLLSTSIYYRVTPLGLSSANVQSYITPLLLPADPTMSIADTEDQISPPLSSLLPSSSITIASDRSSLIVKAYLTSIAQLSLRHQQLKSQHQRRNGHITALQHSIMLHRSFIDASAIRYYYDQPLPYPLQRSSIVTPPLSVHIESCMVNATELLGAITLAHFEDGLNHPQCGMRINLRLRNEQLTSALVISSRYVSILVHIRVENEPMGSRSRSYVWCVPWPRQSLPVGGIIESSVIVPLVSPSPSALHVVVALRHIPHDHHREKSDIDSLDGACKRARPMRSLASPSTS